MVGRMFVTLESDGSVITRCNEEGPHVEVVLSPEEKAFLSYFDGKIFQIIDKFTRAGFRLALKVNGIKKEPRILIVDNDAELVNEMCSVFNQNGYEAVGFTAADKVLEHLNQKSCDIICLGIIMTIPKGWDEVKCDFGKKTGVELVRRIKEIKPLIPLMAFTVIGNVGIRAEMREAGITEIVSKPASNKDLLESAKKLLGN